MTPNEAALIDHYNRHVTYYSPLQRPEGLTRLLKPFDVELVAPVLDLGCGDGRLLDHLTDTAGYVGVDYAEQRTRKAQSRWDAEFVTANLYEWLETNDRRFGSVVAVELFEHLEHPRRIVELALEALQPGGVMVATVPVGMPYEAHLQLFNTPNDVSTILDPDEFMEVGDHWVMIWRT